MKSVLVFWLCCCSTLILSQDVIYGTNNYTSYQRGNLPIVISVPHGGNLNPPSIPDRTCNNPVFATDLNTIEVAQAISTALFEQTGCHPHIIFCHLDRPKLDCNRNLLSGACGHPEAILAWNEFHHFIDTAQTLANQEHDQNILFIDLHGHGHPIQRIELGYLLYDDELELSDDVLDTQEYIDYSSIQNLVANNLNNLSHSALLRGEFALGTLLGNKDFPAVPSQQIPAPGTNTNYFSGGYITANYTSYAPGNEVNGVQMELNFTGIRDTPANHQRFADSLSRVVLDYLDIHRSLNLGTCGATALQDPPSVAPITLSPNPLPFGEKQLRVQGLDTTEDYHFLLVHPFGQITATGKLENGTLQWSMDLPAGFYFLLLQNQAGTSTLVAKFSVQ